MILKTREAGVGLGSIARPLTSLRTRGLNLILMTRAAGGGSGRTAHPLTSVLIQPLVSNLILMTREAGVDLGSVTTRIPDP